MVHEEFLPETRMINTQHEEKTCNDKGGVAGGAQAYTQKPIEEVLRGLEKIPRGIILKGTMYILICHIG